MSNEKKELDTKTLAAVKDIWASLSDELKEKARACKNEKELFAILKGNGEALPDEELDKVAGGAYYVRNDEKNCYDIYLDDGHYLESQGDINHAICVTDFYTFLESEGWFS